MVLLGFGMNLKDVYRAGREGIVFTIVTIFGTLLLGWLVGKLLKVNDKTSSLISSGTAICGGSAIAAVAPAINAGAEEMSVSLGTVFVLNSIALFAFPIIGHALGMTQSEFGIWSAIAIHDTSSVVGAASAYGQEALAIATTVKLARTFGLPRSHCFLCSSTAAVMASTKQRLRSRGSSSFPSRHCRPLQRP